MQDGRFLLCIWTSVMTSSVTCFVAECQLTYWLTITDVSCLRNFCAFCRPSEQAAYLQLTSLSGYFQMRRSSWFSAKNHKNPHLPPWVTSHKKKKKIPSSATINAKVNQSVSLLRSFFYVPLSWCLASLLSSDWPELSLSLFILGITTKTDAALLFLSCTRRSLLYFTPFYSH